MTSKRLHLLLVIGLCLAALALLAGAYGVNKVLTAQARKLTDLKAKSLALDQEQTSLKKAKKDIKTYAELYEITKAVVPEDKDQAQAVREIVNIADANGVSLSSITFPPSNLGGNGPATGSSPSGPAKPAPSAAASGNSKTAGLSQLQPVKNIPGVYELPITVESDANQPVQYFKFINFLNALEHNRRTAQVSNISIEPDPKNPNYLTFTLSLKEYIKP